MEEENPWLDSESVTHNNVKAVKPIEKVDKVNKADKSNKKSVKVSSKMLEKEENREVVYVKEKKEYEDFLQTLMEEFSTDLPKYSKKFAQDNFGEKWLEDFLKDVEDLKEDILSSHFFPTTKEMIFLKYIFILQQGFE